MNGCPRAAVFVRPAFLHPAIPPMAIAHAEVTCQNQSVFWSRRITAEHRLVYAVEGKAGIAQCLIIAACRYHY
jgi:Txe/YoeB family toxin of Txe-Axe toxin-antitoxin module